MIGSGNKRGRKDGKTNNPNGRPKITIPPMNECVVAGRWYIYSDGQMWVVVRNDLKVKSGAWYAARRLCSTQTEALSCLMEHHALDNPHLTDWTAVWKEVRLQKLLIGRIRGQDPRAVLGDED